MSDPTPLKGKIAIVTGGTRGIGAAISDKLVGEGAHVIASFAGNVERANEFAEEINGKYGEGSVQVRQAKVEDPEACKALVEEVYAEHGKLDILVNNAGITRDKLAAKLDAADWQAVIDTNLGGAFYMSQAALPRMVEHGTGRIIMISSLNGEIGNIGQANYSASKAGMIGLTRTLALEAAFSMARAEKLTEDSIGVTVNCITPGYVLTEMVAAMPDKVLDKLKSVIPVRRLARPEEVARVASFLAQDGSSFITGQTWGINGGQHM
ncbi:acetoacetyl-CoA reductase/3-oxoacyl-[acyl-carrier protein] reductase [Kineosphaera limosa]|uniref:Putative acetoacetyl-CoA reductase n=1 Tax=Kineosphaera limosa NBRC 100340 TaxID=1184609 RepID=K6WX55_9MICO|nr:3-oxoacyl-ACP reductase [Kineosphaera limosa]NYE01520.1 acetoacetyl-CoA reductase/3-oxoacyl-[acyl-carrier protein] reductase [Kineosphaera limosa]GAB96677.1 putative acetoacetyl-CoA reductase [Kineosphaera limosa NBRC 100340]